MAKAYPPNHLSLTESAAVASERMEAPAVAADDSALRAYISTFFDQYRRTIDRFFAPLAPALPMYERAPFASTVLRLGSNGVIIGHRPAERATVDVLPLDALDPPLEPGWTLFTLQDRIDAAWLSFDFHGRPYDERQAVLEGTHAALKDALTIFWQLIDEPRFADLCAELVRFQDVAPEQEVAFGDRRFDAVGRVLLQEPAGFRREELWAFEFRHSAADRVSARYIHELGEFLSRPGQAVDVICVLTSGDLTSIGNHLLVENPRIRLWDRAVLDHLIHANLELLAAFFTHYAAALKVVSQEFGPPGTTSSRLAEFKVRLDACPSGNASFAEYEAIGTDLWQYVFPTQLGEPRVQERTIDGTQRRDVLFRNERATKFFGRIAERFRADFVIVDYKNYRDPVGPEVIRDVARYANKALGSFVCVVARHGPDDGLAVVQHRVFRDDDRLVLVISNAQMLEMVARRERGEDPADVLEDALDELLVGY